MATTEPQKNVSSLVIVVYIGAQTHGVKTAARDYYFTLARESNKCQVLNEGRGATTSYRLQDFPHTIDIHC